ncbi:MAG: PepSY-associated TM helix domain-containing protein [Actinomycetota bacterium]
MANLNFRKLHRQIAPIIFLPLIISAITGLIISLAIDWGKVEEESVEILMKIHQGGYLGGRLVPIYVLLVGLGAIAMLVTGLTMSQFLGKKRPERPNAKWDLRKIHQIAAPIIFLPLLISSVTGVIYRLGRNWFGMSNDTGEILLSLHQGEYLGDFLQPIYVLLVGLGAILMLVTGINMTSIFRKRRQPQTDTDSEP